MLIQDVSQNKQHKYVLILTSNILTIHGEPYFF